MNAGNLEFRRILGEGGFGVVAEVFHVLDKKTYALKEINIRSRDDLCTKEVQALAKLDSHLNIVRYYGCWIGEEKFVPDEPESNNPSRENSVSSFYSQPLSSDVQEQLLQRETSETLQNEGIFFCIQMELCPKTLKSWLDDGENVNVSLKKLLTIFFQLAVAVKFIHMKNIMHRDLKPANIFIQISSSNVTLKVGDFGLCDSRDRVYSSGGSELYSAPELGGGHKYDNRVDVYAMGIILFEILFPVKTTSERFEVLRALGTGQFPPQFRDKFPKEEEQIRRMLTHDLDGEKPRPTARQVHIWTKQYRRSIV